MSSQDSRSKRESLEKAIAVQESMRGMIDDAIIDAIIATLKEKLAAKVREMTCTSGYLHQSGRKIT